jgi:competence protein ComGC
MEVSMNNKGLTVIEIIITVAILGMVSLLFVSIFSNGHRFIVEAGTSSQELIDSQGDIEEIITEQGAGVARAIRLESSSDLTQIDVDGVEINDEEFVAFLPGVTSSLINATGVIVSKSTVIFSELNEIEVVTATVSPSDATNQDVEWTSSNESVVTVVSGILESQGYGNATVTVRTDDGGFTDTVSVEVSSSPLSSAAELTELRYGGTLVPGFDPDVLLYEVDVPGNSPPTTTAIALAPAVIISTVQAKNANGNNANSYSYVDVQAEDGTVVTYRILFK